MRIIGELTNMLPNQLIGDLSNVHFYEPHIKLVNKQLDNNPFTYAEPDLEFKDSFHYGVDLFKRNKISFDDFIGNINIDDFRFSNYHSYPKIEAEMYEPKK